MTRLVVRSRAGSADRHTVTAAILGLIGGALAGFVLGELWGPTAVRAVNSTGSVRGARPSLAELVHDALEALARDPEIGLLDLQVVPVNRHTVELRGWVATRAQRARATRLVHAALGADAVVNRLLVRGEDDAAPANLDALSA